MAIYTRNSVCAPIRAEEGITGILTPPNSLTSFCNLPENQQIGGYPTATQLSEFSLDAATLDSEGRCVILEFPALVLIGVYCPANRDESRDEFRIGFLNALDSRVRNLVAIGKRVFLTGDLNIIREELDTANAEEQLRKHGMTGEEYVSTPARRMLNQLLVGGKVIGQKDEEKESAIMWDICRAFHPNRKGMFTCWDTKKNARPGNFGSRIDYVLCSLDCYDWFRESNIQEGLMGSDHCPVYAIFKDQVEIGGSDVHIRDLFSSGMFKGGVHRREWCAKDLLPLSGRLIPEFDRRQSIRDMFSTMKGTSNGEKKSTLGITKTSDDLTTSSLGAASSKSTSVENSAKRPIEKKTLAPPPKRNKVNSSSRQIDGKGQPGKTQSSLMGFFKPESSKPTEQENANSPGADFDPISTSTGAMCVQQNIGTPSDSSYVNDPIASKESWSKLLGKRVAPLCEHGEPCKSSLTKKAGLNCGRSFYMCAKPLGPSGQKERNTKWQCGTFIWSSEWTSNNN